MRITLCVALLLALAVSAVPAIAISLEAQEGLDQVNLIGTYMGIKEVRQKEVVFQVLVKANNKTINFWCIARRYEATSHSERRNGYWRLLNATKGDTIGISGHHEIRDISSTGLRLVIFAEKIIVRSGE